MEDKQKIASSQIRNVTNISIVTNIILIIIKMVIGLMTSSIAMIADAIHSLSDFVTDIGVLFGVHFGAKGPDREHPYGHGRLETLSALFVAAALVVVGAGTIYYAGEAIAQKKVLNPNVPLFTIAIISIITKEWLYQITKKVAIRVNSAAAYANAWHHRSDAFSSVAVLIGYVSLKLGFGYGDQVAAIAVGLMIVWVGVSVTGDSMRELTEGAADEKIFEQLKHIVEAEPSIRQWHNLRTRMVGREVFIDLHILVDPKLTIADAHAISERLENTIHEQMTHPMNITVHIEPDLPELRKRTQCL
jgi:cation diffusion facilitator family transporter